MSKPDSPEDEALRKAYEAACQDLKSYDAGNKDYAVALANVKTLKRLLDDSRPSRIDPNTLVTAGASLLGIVLIIRHEHVNIVTSKALGFVPKLRH